MKMKNLTAVMAGICVATSFVAISLSGCNKQDTATSTASSATSTASAAIDEKVKLLHDISGVWDPANNSGLWTLNYADNRFQVVMDDRFIPATIGDIDTENGTVNLKIQPGSGAEKIMTIHQTWDTAHTTYNLDVTDWDGNRDTLSFVRKIGPDDMNHLLQLQAQSQPQSATQATPAQTAPPPQTSSQDPASSADGDQTYPTSFDCSKARSVPEYLICHDSDLATADRNLSVTYQQAQNAVVDKAALSDRARKQWNFREKNCHDKACLLSWYQYESSTFKAITQTGDVNVQVEQEQP